MVNKAQLLKCNTSSPKPDSKPTFLPDTRFMYRQLLLRIQ